MRAVTGVIGLLFIVGGGLVGWSQETGGASAVILATADTAPYVTTAGDGFYDRLLGELGRRVRLSFRIEHYPSERGLIEASRGRVDGEFARTAAVAEQYESLVTVPEPLAQFQFVAITRTGAVPPVSFESLADQRVAFINGWKIYENAVTSYRDLTLAESERQLFSLLTSGRVDTILYSRYRALAWSDENPGVPLVVADQPLAVRDMHLLLHESRSDLIDVLVSGLQEIRADGTYRDIYLDVFGFEP